MTEEYRTFVETMLEAQVALRPDQVYMIATRMMADPLLLKLHEERCKAWWDAQPFSAMDVEGMENNPEAPLFEITFPNFWLEVAQNLSRNDRLALRKKYAN
jgi:hypothetical protein